MTDTLNPKAMGKDLHLHFKFTDRGGSSVYDVFLAEDRLRMKESLGEIRISPDMEAFRIKSPTTGHGTG